MPWWFYIVVAALCLLILGLIAFIIYYITREDGCLGHLCHKRSSGSQASPGVVGAHHTQGNNQYNTVPKSEPGPDGLYMDGSEPILPYYAETDQLYSELGATKTPGGKIEIPSSEQQEPENVYDEDMNPYGTTTSVQGFVSNPDRHNNEQEHNKEEIPEVSPSFTAQRESYTGNSNVKHIQAEETGDVYAVISKPKTDGDTSVVENSLYQSR